MLLKFFNRIIPFLVPVFVFVMTEQILLAPKQLYWLLAAVLLVCTLSIWQLTGQRVSSVKFWRFLITPLLFTAGGILYLIFLEDPFYKQLFLLVYTLMIWIFLEVIYMRFNFRPKYQVHSLENIFTHLDIVALFLISSGLFSLIVFLNFDFWISFGIFSLVCLLLTYQLVWTADAILATAWPHAIVITLATAEMFLAISFLPTSIYVNGLLVTLTYYLISGLSRNALLGHLQYRVVRRYVAVSVLAAIIVLATAKWF